VKPLNQSLVSIVRTDTCTAAGSASSVALCGGHGRGNVSGLGEGGLGPRIEKGGHCGAGQLGNAQGGGRQGGH